MRDASKGPSWKVSLIPFAVLIASMALVISVFGSDAIDGASQVALLFSAAVCVFLATVFCKAKWKDMDDAISDNIRSIGSAIIILFLIGAISGSWMLSGVVPTLICYGLKIISPKIFLLAACVICALVSLMTGSSWTTIATIGVALIGIGDAQGYSTGLTAGAIISGAYFGDKISPLSDTTILASSVSRTPLFTHIRYMMITTVPSFTIALLIFLVIGFFYDASDVSRVQEFSDSLHGAFLISPWLLVVPVVTGIMIAKKLPALVVLFLSALMAGIAALIAQPDIISAAGDGNMFRGLVVSYYGNVSVDTGDATLNALVATRGMKGMLSTVFLIICAATFGGVMSGSGMIQSLTSILAKGIKGRSSLVGATVASGIASNMMTGDQYLSILLTCNLYGKLYNEKGYESRLLSRSTEDSATVTSVLIPWNSCGMTQATVLKVPTLDYLPYCFFNILSPLMSIFIAIIGYKIFKNDCKTETAD